MEGQPNFSAFPFDQLRVVTRRMARLESLLARWLPGDVKVVPPVAIDPFAAWCAVRIDGAEVRVAGPNRLVRQLAQQALGGPKELDAPRPCTLQEQALWAGFVQQHVDADVVVSEPMRGEALAIAVRGQTVVIVVPPGFELRVPPARPPSVHVAFAFPVVVARCALAGPLKLRDVVLVERVGPEIAMFDGVVQLSARGMEARVASEYVPRAMALPEGHVELTVTVGSVRMTLRELAALSVGSVVPLARPLSGPFELCANGQVIGGGELINIDGELGVRVIRIDDAPSAP